MPTLVDTGILDSKMSYQLPPEIDQRIQAQIALGIYQTPTEVLNDALDALDQRNQDRQAIQEGIDAWRAGDTEDLDQFDAEFRARNGIPADG